MASDCLHVEDISLGLRRLTLHRPTRANALSQELLDALTLAIQQSQAEPHIRCLILRGDGGKTFSSGYDTSLLQPEPFRHQPDPIGPVVQAIQLGRLPVVACVNGHVLGGAVEIAAACDLRLAQAGAKIGIPAVGFGICYAPRGLRHLKRALGIQLASELLLSGQRIKVERAAVQGFFSQVVDPDKIDQAALSIGQAISAAAPLAVEAMRRILRGDPQQEETQELSAETAEMIFRRSLDSQDLNEGLVALAQGRPPKFARK